MPDSIRIHCDARRATPVQQSEHTRLTPESSSYGWHIHVTLWITSNLKKFEGAPQRMLPGTVETYIYIYIFIYSYIYLYI